MLRVLLNNFSKACTTRNGTHLYSILVKNQAQESESSGLNPSSSTSGKLHNLSVPQFSHLENRDSDITAWGCVGTE